MEGAAGRLMAMLRACVADCGPALLASVTLTVKFAVVFGPVGVPVIAPEEELNERPAGREPALKE